MASRRPSSASLTDTAAVTLLVTALDRPLTAQLAPELIDRWRRLEHLPHTTPRQLLTHTSGGPNYFREESFAARLREDPDRPWRPVELVDHAAGARNLAVCSGPGFDFRIPDT